MGLSLQICLKLCGNRRPDQHLLQKASWCRLQIDPQSDGNICRGVKSGDNSGGLYIETNLKDRKPSLLSSPDSEKRQINEACFPLKLRRISPIPEQQESFYGAILLMIDKSSLFMICLLWSWVHNLNEKATHPFAWSPFLKVKLKV